MEAIMNAAQKKQEPELLDILNRQERLADIMSVLETVRDRVNPSPLR